MWTKFPLKSRQGTKKYTERIIKMKEKVENSLKNTIRVEVNVEQIIQITNFI